MCGPRGSEPALELPVVALSAGCRQQIELQGCAIWHARNSQISVLKLPFLALLYVHFEAMAMRGGATKLLR